VTSEPSAPGEIKPESKPDPKSYNSMAADADEATPVSFDSAPLRVRRSPPLDPIAYS
jgi:hypothetical protein